MIVLNDAKYFSKLNTQVGNVKAIGSSVTLSEGNGLVDLTLASDIGKVHTIPNIEEVYVRSSPYDLLPPQILIKIYAVKVILHFRFITLMRCMFSLINTPVTKSRIQLQFLSRPTICLNLIPLRDIVSPFKVLLVILPNGYLLLPQPLYPLLLLHRTINLSTQRRELNHTVHLLTNILFLILC